MHKAAGTAARSGTTTTSNTRTLVAPHPCQRTCCSRSVRSCICCRLLLCESVIAVEKSLDRSASILRAFTCLAATVASSNLGRQQKPERHSKAHRVQVGNVSTDYDRARLWYLLQMPAWPEQGRLLLDTLTIQSICDQTQSDTPPGASITRTIGPSDKHQQRNDLERFRLPGHLQADCCCAGSFQGLTSAWHWTPLVRCCAAAGHHWCVQHAQQQLSGTLHCSCPADDLAVLALE